MTNTTQTAHKRPDYIAYSPVPNRHSSEPATLVRIGVGFIHRNGSIGVLYDAIPLSGHLVLVGPDEELPNAISHGQPTTAPAYDVCMVREVPGKDSFWTEVGTAYRQDGYVSVFCPLVPTAGKIVLTQPRDAK